MRLAPKIFIASALVILVLAGVGSWSFRAVNSLVEVNRDIATRSLPALSLEASLRESIKRLVRLEARYLVLRDRAYANLWTERAARVATDLDLLLTYLASREELDAHRQAAQAFDRYREHVERERALVARGEVEAALRLSERQARSAAELMENGLNQLAEATYSTLGRSQAEAKALEQRTWRGVVAALVGSLVLALAVTGFLALRMTRSLHRLSTATAELAEGEFTEPLPAEGRDEIGHLARSFNRMAERLREVDALKEEFFSHVSHELRQPITAVRAGTQMLLQRARGPLTPEQERLVQLVGASTERLLGMVNQILEFTRLRARLWPLERRMVDLEKVVARALDEVRLQAEQQGVTLKRSIGGADLTLLADEQGVLSVLVNLLGNALKFTPRGGLVTVYLEDRGPELELSVEDTGVGIPAEALPRVFDPYRQAHRGRKGSGLGLAIVRGLVEAHDGRVEVESEEGKGTRFIVRLPRRHHAEDQSGPAASVSLSEPHPAETAAVPVEEVPLRS